MKVHSGEESVVAAGRSEKYAESDRPASAGEANYRNGSSTRQQNRTKEKDPEEPGFKERMRSVFKSFFE
jgi:cell division protein FtsA